MLAGLADLAGQESACPDPVPVEIGAPGPTAGAAPAPRAGAAPASGAGAATEGSTTVSGPLTWRAEPGLEPVARALAGRRELYAPLPGIGPIPAALQARPTVYLLEDLGCLEELGLTGVQPDWVAGLASPGGNFIVLRADRARGDLETLPATFRHEVAHLALHQATAGNVPRWLQEGYAQYAAGSWDWQAAWRLRFVLLTGGGDLLRELRLGFPGDAEGAREAYMLSYTAVQELANLAGPEGLAAVFARLREGDDLDRALRRTFGLTEDQFEERWRKAVASRYGILFILSRATVFWVAVTLLLLWFGWRRRKRDREKMDRLRAEERWEAEWLREGEWLAGPVEVGEDPELTRRETT